MILVCRCQVVDRCSHTAPYLENPEYETRWYFKYFLGRGEFSKRVNVAFVAGNSLVWSYAAYATLACILDGLPVCGRRITSNC